MDFTPSPAQRESAFVRPWALCGSVCVFVGCGFVERLLCRSYSADTRQWMQTGFCNYCATLVLQTYEIKQTTATAVL